MDGRILRVINLMEISFNKELTLRKLAESIHLSPSRLRHIFKTETGLTVAKYLKLIRMERAKELVNTSHLSAKEIMMKVGLSDKSHFERDFKRTYGLTPMQYRAHFLSVSSVRSPVGSQIGHQTNSSAMQIVLQSMKGNPNLSALPKPVDNTLAIVNFTNPKTEERSDPQMDEKVTTSVETEEIENFDGLFEELSVTELEDRLELADRCICRIDNN